MITLCILGVKMKRIKPYIENKYLVSNIDKQRFLCAFKNLLVPDENGENGHYFVSSIYFDTDNFDFYQDKLEGEFFKLKIRIRRYSLDSKTWVSPKLELKIKHSENTIKYSRIITSEDVDRLSKASLSGYEVLKMFNFDKKIPKEYLLGRVFKPVTEIIYDRDAYTFPSVPDFRITFDYKICLENLLKRGCKKTYLPEIKNIFELKTNLKIPDLFLEWLKNRNILQEHVSKYSISVEKIIRKGY